MRMTIYEVTLLHLHILTLLDPRRNNCTEQFHENVVYTLKTLALFNIRAPGCIAMNKDVVFF